MNELRLRNTTLVGLRLIQFLVILAGMKTRWVDQIAETKKELRKASKKKQTFAPTEIWAERALLLIEAAYPSESPAGADVQELERLFALEDTRR